MESPPRNRNNLKLNECSAPSMQLWEGNFEDQEDRDSSQNNTTQERLTQKAKLDQY